MDLGLSGKTALILGGSQGLGFAAARRLAEEGARVAIVGRDGARLAKALDMLRPVAPEAMAIPHDLADAESLPALLERVDGSLGGVDILLLNGGGPPPSPAATIDPGLWRGQFDAMVLSGLGIAAHVLPGMRRRRFGRILVVASTSIREPIPGLTLSNALRGAVAGWAKTLAGEVARDGVTVNLLLPGRLATERTARLDALDAEERGVDAAEIAAASQAEIPAGRYGGADEFGAVAAFLASAPAGYVTGAAIPIDGGLSRSML